MDKNKITNRQIEALELRAAGFANKQIASSLGISITAVANRLKLACRNLGASDITHAVAIGIVEGLIQYQGERNDHKRDRGTVPELHH